VQVALILVLALLLGATHVRLPALTELRVDLEPQEVVAIQQMQQTRQQETAPPPPRPAPPIEVSNDVVLEEQEVNFDASLDLTEELAVTGPPPAPEPPAPAEEERVEEIFVVVEEAPTLIGGMAGLHANVRYPETARRAGVQGRVIVQFVVDEDGRVVDPVVLAGRHPLLDKEALRVIQEARFTPGRQRGTPVKVRMSIPITFVLQDR
jgi:protein TonB